MKHYFISGRIPGDDEDTGLPVGQHPNTECAIAAYQREMRRLGGLDLLDSEALAANFGADVFVNLVVGADTPIENLS